MAVELLIETLLPIIHTLDSHLKQRSETYKGVINGFSFLSQLKTIDSDQLTKNLQNSIMKTLTLMSSNQNVFI